MRFKRPAPARRATIPGRQLKIFLPALILAALWLLAPAAHAQQPTAAKTFRLGSVEVKGLQRYTREQTIVASGLQIGQQIEVAALDQAARRLLDSGLFVNVSYRIRSNGNEATVTFEVEETRGVGVPVVFDNFVWFTDEEVANAVRRSLPSFDGTAPESTAVINNITKALEQLLEERKIQGQVDYTPSADPSGRNAKHVFSVRGADLKICALHFPGAARVQESELQKKSKPLFENDYSREFVGAFAVANLIPVYRERGHLRAAFRAASATVEAGAENCKGVSVNIPVEEGGAYSWEGAEWAGNSSFSAGELETALGMKARDLANGLKIDAGINSVEKLYGRKGFLSARVADEPVFDDAGLRVTYRISITEGPQYRMGTLTITGLSEADTNSLKGKWNLRPGDIYDASYYKDEYDKKAIKQYMESLFRERKTSAKLPHIEVSAKPNRQTLTVDFVIEFKNPSQAERP